MTFLLIAAMVAVMILLYTTDRILKALTRGRRYRRMSERLDAAAAKSEAQQEQRETAAAASTELTSVMPAIKRPPLTLPGRTRRPQSAVADCEAKPTCEAKPAHEATTGRDCRPGHSGEQQRQHR
jgi:hypothetical protein